MVSVSPLDELGVNVEEVLQLEVTLCVTRLGMASSSQIVDVGTSSWSFKRSMVGCYC